MVSKIHMELCWQENLSLYQFRCSVWESELTGSILTGEKSITHVGILSSKSEFREVRVNITLTKGGCGGQNFNGKVWKVLLGLFILVMNSLLSGWKLLQSRGGFMVTKPTPPPLRINLPNRIPSERG